MWLATVDMRLFRSTGAQVTFSIPDVTRSAIVERPDGDFAFSENFRGLGDASAVFWHRRVIRGWNVTFNAGLSLPIGKTETPRFRPELDDGSLVPVSRLQRGTGTFDPLFGATMNRTYSALLPPGTRLFASAAVRAPLVDNEHGLRTGASSEVGFGGARETFWHQLVLIARVSWLHRAQDVFAGTPVLVGGGDWVYFAPAAAVSLGEITVQAEFKLPIHRALANRQLDSARSFQIGMIWTPF